MADHQQHLERHHHLVVLDVIAHEHQDLLRGHFFLPRPSSAHSATDHPTRRPDRLQSGGLAAVFVSPSLNRTLTTGARFHQGRRRTPGNKLPGSGRTFLPLPEVSRRNEPRPARNPSGLETTATMTVRSRGRREDEERVPATNRGHGGGDGRRRRPRLGRLRSAAQRDRGLPLVLRDSCGAGLSPHELVRLKMIPANAGQPLRVIAICLPFVYEECPAARWPPSTPGGRSLSACTANAPRRSGRRPPAPRRAIRGALSNEPGVADHREAMERAGTLRACESW